MSEMRPNSSFQFILKPVIACNLACEYCYASRFRRDACPRMTLAEARTAVDWAVAFCRQYGVKRVSVLWQGGEPLLAGAEFIDQIAAYYEGRLSNLGIACESILQTNLLLMDETMLPVVKRHFRGEVGFSYDYLSGTRVYPDGRNAADDIWSKALWCKRQGLTVGAICQVTNANISRMRELYDFFNGQGILLKISQVFPSQGATSENALSIPPERSAEAVCELFDCWFDDPDARIEVSNLKALVAALLCGRSGECCRQENCAPLLLSLIPDGRILPCARFDCADDVIGNYYSDSPDQVMVARLRHQRQRDRADGHCRDCRYRKICHGGCYYNRLTGWHEGECVSNRIILAHIERRLNERGLQFACLEDDLAIGAGARVAR